MGKTIIIFTICALLANCNCQERIIIFPIEGDYAHLFDSIKNKSEAIDWNSNNGLTDSYLTTYSNNDTWPFPFENNSNSCAKNFLFGQIISVGTSSSLRRYSLRLSIVKNKDFMELRINGTNNVVTNSYRDLSVWINLDNGVINYFNDFPSTNIQSTNWSFIGAKKVTNKTFDDVYKFSINGILDNETDLKTIFISKKFGIISFICENGLEWNCDIK